MELLHLVAGLMGAPDTSCEEQVIQRAFSHKRVKPGKSLYSPLKIPQGDCLPGREGKVKHCSPPKKAERYTCHIFTFFRFFPCFKFAFLRLSKVPRRGLHTLQLGTCEPFLDGG